MSVLEMINYCLGVIKTVVLRYKVYPIDEVGFCD